MDKDSRLFNCVRCHQQCVICSCCDRGNIYCSPQCSQLSRQELKRASNRRYQNTQRGKHHHASRQRRYRQRQKKIVTHQGSPIHPANDLLSPELIEPTMRSMPVRTRSNRCHFCHKSCSGFIRIGFMRSHARVQTQRKTSWPLGP